MDIKIKVGEFCFTINSKWLDESGLKPLSKISNHYVYKTTQDKAEPIILVGHNDIDPNIREEGVPIFKDGNVEGKFLTAKTRVLNILSAIVNETTLPPIEIVEAKQGAYKYKLHHGCHRLHLSVLAGYKLIPAKINTYL